MGMFETYTIKDIAKALGLSKSTVSRALNGSYEIGAETKKRVLQYAESINYRPNPIALSLKVQKSRSLGVVVAEVANTYFSQAINGIESIAYDRGYHVIITQTHESAAREEINIKHLLSRHVDGLLISISGETVDLAYYHNLLERGVPIVFFDRTSIDVQTHKVTVNNYKGAFDATEHLITQGFKHIAHLTGAAHLSTTEERLSGYKDALANNGYIYVPELVRFCANNGMLYHEIEASVKELMKINSPPDAFFVGGDRLTTGCISILKEMGLKIPENVAVVGFSNSDVGQLFDPPLTVVRQPAFQTGQLATELLIEMIERKYPLYKFKTEVLDTELIIRSSSVG